MHTVAIVEDNAHLRELLARQLQRCHALTCCGAYADAEQALREIPRRKPAIVLMDIKLPGMDGIECTRQLRKARSEEHTSELQSLTNLVCRLLLEKKKK